VTVQPGQSIQQAINNAVEGAVICLSAGIYQEDTEIIVNRNLTLRGAGREQTTLTGKGGGFAFISIESDTEIQVMLEPFTIAQKQFRDIGIWVQGRAQVRLTEIAISGIHVFGLQVKDLAQARVVNARIAEAKIGLGVRGSARVTMTNSQISENTHGVLPQDRAMITLTDSVISRNGVGINLWNGAGDSVVSLVNVQLSNNDFGLGGSGTIHLTRSTIAGNGATGITLGYQAIANLINSTISGNGKTGLEVWDTAQVELKDSVIRDNKSCGLWVWEGGRVRGTPIGMGGNGADLCGYAPAEVRKPLVPQTERTVLTVPGDYATLQEAVDAIAPGGTITVATGTYETGLTIWKKLQLRGGGQGQTTLKALSGRQLAISVIAEVREVVLEGLTVRDSQFNERRSPSSRIDSGGLLIFGQAALSDVQITGNARTGLTLAGSAQVKVQRSTIEGNNKSGNQNGMGNPGNHPFKNLPVGQVCLP
jgi:nitrous oxidase accessory protein NosD